MPDQKPPFDPAKPSTVVAPKSNGNKPAFNPNKPFEEVVEVNPATQYDSFNPFGRGVDKQNIDKVVGEIVRTSRVGISESEQEMIKDMLKNPNLTPEQAKESIQAIQGYHPKQAYNTFTTPEYYVKTDENGVTRPIPLSKGELPPKGYNVANVWGQTKKDAQDDSWYTDLAKSVFNILPSLSQSTAEVGNWASNLITGEDSEFFKRAANTSESLKLEKDLNGGKTIYNPEGAKSFSELFTADKFDLSKESLWNTINWAVETLPQFMVGAGEAKVGIQGAKLATNALRGVEGVSEIGKAGNAAAMFASSFTMQIGENMESAREAGLNGSDAAKVAGAITTVQAAIDAYSGLDIGSKLLNRGFVDSEKKLLSSLIKELPKTETGQLTKESMDELGKLFIQQYRPMAASFAKAAAKDVAGEMSEEVIQEFTSKAGQQIWDNMSAADKAKFGTDAFDARSFGDYLSAGINSLGVAPVSVLTANPKDRYEEQSKEAFDIISGGKPKIDEFKANVYAAQRRGDMTEAQRDQAIFKIDQYDKYWNQTKGLNMSPEDRKKALELSYNIDALKSELPKEDVELDPITTAKVESKKELIKGLQLDLNGLVLRQEVINETKVGQKTVDKVAKDVMPPKEGEKKPTLDDIIGKFKPVKTEGIKFNQEQAKPARRKIEEVDVPTWNDRNKTSSLERKRIVQEHLKNTPNNEIDAQLQEGENGTIIAVMPDGKILNLAQSAESNSGKTETYLVRENLPATKEEMAIEDRGGMPADVEGEGKPLYRYKEPVAIKRVEIDSYDKEGNQRMKDGKPIRKAVLSVYNKETGGHIGYVRELDPYKGVYRSSEYSPKEKEQLNQIKAANHLGEEIKPFLYNPEAAKDYNKPVWEKKAKKAKEKVEIEEKMRLPKPKLSLTFIKDNKLLKSQMGVVKKRTPSGKVQEIKQTVKGKQAAIEAEAKRLEQLIDCIWG